MKLEVRTKSFRTNFCRKIIRVARLLSTQKRVQIYHIATKLPNAH
jgi:hypothetical protein